MTPEKISRLAELLARHEAAYKRQFKPMTRTTMPYLEVSPYRVRAKRCNECLFSINAIVSIERRAQILRELEEHDDWFICHLSDGTLRCRGDYDHRRHARCDRLAKALGIEPIFVSGG